MGRKDRRIEIERKGGKEGGSGRGKEGRKGERKWGRQGMEKGGKEAAPAAIAFFHVG